MSKRWKGWGKLQPKLKSGKPLLLLLDFDGTLAPIVSLPQNAQLPARAKETLRRLIANPLIKVVVISGRALPDIKRKISLRGMWYVGNHGLEIEGPYTFFEHPRIVRQPKIMNSLAERFKKEFRHIKGVIVQNKRLSLSIHFRNVKKKDEREFYQTLQESLALTTNLPVEWRLGRKVYEVIPAVDWNKGRAAVWLLKKFRHPFPLVFGDDRTDDSMFQMLKTIGISTKIGTHRGLAQYSLKNPGEVSSFLGLLEKNLRKKG